MSLKAKDIAKSPDELLSGGHRLCPGCGEGTATRLLLKASKDPIIAVSATGCLEVSTSIYPYTSWKIPWIHNAFENAAATASGIEATLKSFKRRGKMKRHINVLALAGDGGTIDIGIQALSGALERGHDFVYVLLDNEAYMNTGIQRSGGTSRYAWTTTSPAGKVIPGKVEWKKPIARIAVEHEIPYVATASPAYWRDLMQKAQSAYDVQGPAFMHVFASCQRGWRHDPALSVKVARVAVETCFFPLWEAALENGKAVYKLSTPSKIIVRKPEKKRPVEEFLKIQGRFRHLFRPERRDDIIKQIQAHVDKNWELIMERCGEK
ncbi:MAG: thiamine pyrophosphate-dependent enzyme [Promethearchaeota archaeon]